MPARLFLAAAIALLLAGCASHDRSLPAASSDSHHPANPNAAESPVAAHGGRTTHDEMHGGGMVMQHEHGGGGGVTRPAATTQAAGDYTCPMHPQVSSATPGKCPMCGMTMEPREKLEAGHDHSQHEHGKGDAK